jgi:hypothetical protein
MSIPFMSLLHALGYATFGVTVTAIAIWLLLRWCRVQSPTIQRFAWLLAGTGCFWRMSMELPVLPPQRCAGLTSPEIGQGVDIRRRLGDFFEVRLISYEWQHARWALGWMHGRAGRVGARAYCAGSPLGSIVCRFARGLPRPLPSAVGWEKN